MASVQERTTQSSPSTRHWMVLLLVVFAIYAPSLANEFAEDDVFRVRAVRPDGEPNPITDRLHPITDYFAFRWEDYPEIYRPVTVWSYALANELTGGADADPAWEALPHHLLNVLLMLWAVVLAGRILTHLTSRSWPALLGAGVFGLHAIHSEVVAGIVGRSELFAFCFGAQALLLFVSRPESSARRNLCRVASACLLFLAFCSKESAVAWFPFLIVFLIATRTADIGRRILAAVAVAAPPLALFLVLRHQALDDSVPILHSVNPLAHEGNGTRVMTGVVLQGYGLWKCVWPFPLIGDYGAVTFEPVRSSGDLRFLLSAAVLVGWLLAGLVLVRRHPLVFAAMACFLGFGFLTSNIPFAIGTIFGERLLFTPSLGIAMLVAWLATIVKARWLLVPLGIWVAASAVVIVRNNGAWASDEDLILRDVEANPRSVRRLDQRARQLRDAKRADEAETMWRRALELDPQYPLAVNELALHLAESRRFAEAEKLLVGALAIPEHRRPRRHITRLNLSVLYERMGQKEESLAQLRLAWREDSAFTERDDGLIARSQALLPVAEIRAVVDAGERRAPGNPQWPLVRGKLAFDANDLATAEREFRRALARRPRHAPSRFALASVLRARGQEAEARQMFEELRSDPSIPEYIRSQVIQSLK